MLHCSRFHTPRLSRPVFLGLVALGLPYAATSQGPARAYFTAAGRRTLAPDSAAYYTLTRRQGAGGTVVTFRPDGRRLHQETYANLATGQLHGPSTGWTAGRRTALYPYQRGQLHGLAQAWYPSGRRRWQLGYVRGQRHGSLRGWSAAGRLLRLETYRRGVRTGGRCFTTKGRDTAYFELNRPASFAGGPDSLRGWVARRLRYPAVAMRNQVEGRVYVRFHIDKQGQVQGPWVRRGLGAGCDEEALRVIGLMPCWRPAVAEGQAVPVEYELPVEFSLR